MSLTCVAGLKFKMSIFFNTVGQFPVLICLCPLFYHFFWSCCIPYYSHLWKQGSYTSTLSMKQCHFIKKISKSSSYVKENAIRKPEYLKSDWMERLQLCSFHFPFPQWLLCTIKTILIQNEQTVNRDSHWKPHKCQDGICTYEIQTSSKPVILHSRLFLWACRRWGSCMAVTEMRCK